MKQPKLLLVDTNIWLDVFDGERPKHIQCSAFVAEAVARGIELAFAVSSAKDVYYVMAAVLKRRARLFFTTTKFRISRLISFGFHRFAKVPHPFFANCPIFPSSRLPRTFCSARRTQPADHDA